MSSPLKFILGSQELLNSRKRKIRDDHEKIGLSKYCRQCREKGRKKNCHYCTHRFSKRTWRDIKQTPGELYMGD